MMQAFAAILLLAVATAPAAAGTTLPEAEGATACAPPCGPIPVIITILLEKSKGIVFPEDGKFVANGKVQYYWDIDQGGYGFDPRESVEIVFKVNKQPPWVKTTIEPPKVPVPLFPHECPTCHGPDPEAPELAYFYEAPIKVTVEKLREPTGEELRRWAKSDGSYRASISATSNDNMVAPDATGTQIGLMEGYGYKDIRFVASQHAIAPEAAAQPEANMPGPGLGLLVAALVATGLAVRGLRKRPT